MSKVYGNLTNRLEENKNYTHRELQPGDDITMYYWSDRSCYYITEVISQKEIKVKKYHVCADQEKPGGPGHQNWLYFKSKKEENEYLNKFFPESYHSDYENEEETWTFRYGHWYNKYATNDGKATYSKLQPISFGVRDYYYDWEF